MTLSTLDIKLISIILLFCFSIVFGIIPYFIKRKQNNTTNSNNNNNSSILSFCNAFSGGVFLGAGMLHLFADSTIGLLVYSEKYNNYPISAFCLCVGFLFIFFLELIIHNILNRIAIKKEKDKIINSKETTKQINQQYENISLIDSSSRNSTNNSGIGEINNSNVDCSSGSSNSCEEFIDDKEDIEAAAESESLLSRREKSSNESILNIDDQHESNEHNIHHGHSHDIDIEVSRNKYIPYILVIGLSVHSIFEGIALGIQTTHLRILDILIAIFAHKFLASFALGVNIVQSSIHSKLKFSKLFSLIFVFSLSSPIGSIIGLLISNLNCSLVSSILQGVASGTFLYISVVEIIPKEVNHNSKHLVFKSILLLLGWSIMAIVALWI